METLTDFLCVLWFKGKFSRYGFNSSTFSGILFFWNNAYRRKWILALSLFFFCLSVWILSDIKVHILNDLNTSNVDLVFFQRCNFPLNWSSWLKYYTEQKTVWHKKCKIKRKNCFFVSFLKKKRTFL